MRTTRRSANPAITDPGLAPATARWIMVAGVGPTVGATTLTALLTWVYAAHRRYRIAAVDASPTSGALGIRLGIPGVATVAEVAAAAPDLTSFKRLGPYLDRTSQGCWAVAGRVAAELDVAQCRAAIAAMTGFFAVGLVDCGPTGTATADALLGAAHARLLVAPVTVEGVLGAASALDWLSDRAGDDSAWHCGVALVSTTQRPDTDVGWAARLLTGRGGRVIPVPYDPGLVPGGLLTPGAVSDGALGAARRLATEMLSRSTRVET